MAHTKCSLQCPQERRKGQFISCQFYRHQAVEDRDSQMKQDIHIKVTEILRERFLSQKVTLVASLNKLNCQERPEQPLRIHWAQHVLFGADASKQIQALAREGHLPIRPIFIPERARALRADWAPGPGVLVLFPPVARSLMCRAVIPSSLHLWATSWAANIAAYGEDSSRSAFTFIPPVTRQMVSLGTKAQGHFFLVQKGVLTIS